MTTPQGSLSLRHYGASHGGHAHAHFQVLLGLDGVLELESRAAASASAPARAA